MDRIEVKIGYNKIVRLEITRTEGVATRYDDLNLMTYVRKDLFQRCRKVIMIVDN